MPRMGGIELLDEIGTAAPDALTVIMTGFGTVETAIDAMKRGAYDYILKPFKVDEVIHVVQRGLEKQRLAAENLRLREALSLYKVSEAIAASLSLDEVLATVADSCLHEVARRPRLDLARRRRGRLLRAPAPRAPPTLPPAEDASLGATLDAAAWSLEQLRHERPARSSSRAPTRPAASSRRSRRRSPLVSLVAVPAPDAAAAPRLHRASPRSPRARRFDEGQRKLLSIIGSRAAAAIENARLYEDLQATFQQTIEGLAKAIDKMDRYTAGHSERVAIYATYLARAPRPLARGRSRSSARAR